MATATKAKPATRPVPTGKLIDQIWAAREEKRRLEVEVKEVETVMAELEQQLMESMEAEGLEKAIGTKASVSITTSTVADVKDWDEFWKYIFKNKFSHLLQRRVSEPAYRELLEAGKKVPGVEPFNKRKLNLRSL